MKWDFADEKAAWTAVDGGGDINESERWSVGVVGIGPVLAFGSKEIAEYVAGALNRFEAYRATERTPLRRAVERFAAVWRHRSKAHFGDRELMAVVRPLLLLAAGDSVEHGDDLGGDDRLRDARLDANPSEDAARRSRESHRPPGD